MTGRATALRSAIDLVQAPSRVRVAQSGPLPADVPLLLRVAARDEEALSHAEAASGRSRELIHAAAMFFVEQILLDPRSDSYRILGGDPSTPAPDLRRNMALLLRSLHPDIDPQGDSHAAAARIAQAWNNVKTPERRAAYDAHLAEASPRPGRLLARKRSRRRLPAPKRVAVARRPGLLLRALLFLFRRRRATDGA
ncbi:MULTISPECIES: hypothetical protein [Methylosinus]|uniref:Molecular chaperone DnaJ n=1 Tax=Methylosinus trichosporium (strain ATCC 35070 / NCIMB 11131 / UNIQEM 75 / OB3b) TaxID=595536 RepID=A0A2D2D3F9_METT3|nr:MULTISPECIES: hypothetical protein [Methylosinus]ATQ69399.1 molecular chaperone DnaJ [Methylosinus trichosporium OB3b]OBS52910.1 hypothetical protein A8B73_08450 [Methylosinus sp. 3S-1]